MSIGFEFYFINLPWLILLPAAVAISLDPGGFPCNETCGNVSIPSPFGIKEGCYPNPWFKVSCNETNDGKKLFISRINLELIGSHSTSAVKVNSPVTHVNCGDEEEGQNGTIAVVSDYLTGSPFFLSERENIIGAKGCGNLVTIVNNNKSTVVGGCLQPRCGRDMSSNGCYVQMLEQKSFKSLSAIITKFYTASKRESNRCSSIFIAGLRYLNLETTLFPDIYNHSTQLAPAVLKWATPVECNLEAAKCRKLLATLEDPDCNEKCGDVDIQYPFGMKDGCYKDEWFQVICKETPNGRKPFMRKMDLQILSVSFPLGIVRVNHSVTFSNCRHKDSDGVSANLKDSPFLFSDTYNRFGSIGCGNLVTIFHNQTDLITSCMQPSCGNDVTSNHLSCILPIPPEVRSFFVNMSSDYPGNDVIIGRKLNSSCGSAFVISGAYSSEELSTMSTATYLPAELEWAKQKRGLCEFKEDFNISCTSDGKYCWTNLSPKYLCVCSNAENSVASSSDICRESGKCKYPNFNDCHMLCLNEPNGNCPTQCPDGYITSGDMCEIIYDYGESITDIILSFGITAGAILLLFVGLPMYQALKRRKMNKLRQENFKRNGGLLLQQQLSTNEDNFNKIKLFKSKELEKSTDHYNENRVLGRGGQGTVYKGMLADGSIVAIKKSKMAEEKKLLDDKKLQQFVNEVIILSQINHRNVIKLLGCCLETEVPLLVYEFIPNGTLSQLMEDQNDEFPLTWEMRLRIATEIASALSYLHSAASLPIYHRDIKSSNILLDDKYRAKVSDFGTSRSIALEQTHLTTRVQGTFGYMDPEYFRSSQFTEKSDVYSFGVVLIELLTGQKPILSTQSEEVRSLVPFFLHNMKQNSLFEILDSSMENNGPQEEIVAVAKLAKRCLNVNGKKRPTMKHVAMELEMIRKSEEINGIQQSSDEDFDSDDAMEGWTMDSCSTMSMINNIATLP